MRLTSFAAPIFAILSSCMSAQTAQRPAMTNIDVARMIQAGVSEGVVLIAVRNCEPHFLLLPDSTAALIKTGVSDNVIRAMAASQHAISRAELKQESKEMERESTGNRVVLAGSKVFISRMEGDLHNFLGPELIRKRVPVVVTTDESVADYILTGASPETRDKWYHTVLGGKDKTKCGVHLVSVKDNQLVWTGEAGDGSLLWGMVSQGGQRKVAARIANTMKQDLFE